MSWIVQSRRLAVFSMIAACQASPPPLQSQTPLPAILDSLHLVLRWGSLDSAATVTGPAREIRWNWNGTVIRLDTVTSFADSVVVPVPSEGKPDTVVVAVWPLAAGPPLLRRLVILDAPTLARQHNGHLPPTLVFDHRRDRLPEAQSGGVYLALDFDDPTDLGVTCWGEPCPFPDGQYRKHTFVARGGLNGSGAINMHWQTGMPIGFSPVWIELPFVRHFKFRYSAKQTAPMRSAGSAQKMMRMRSGENTIGMLESNRGQFVWHWDFWLQGAAKGATDLRRRVFSDSRWHTYEFEVDYRNIANLKVTIWFDGVPARTITYSSTQDFMAGPIILSPFTEMYSCGRQGCSASINTGDYTVDDFSFTILP